MTTTYTKKEIEDAVSKDDPKQAFVMMLDLFQRLVVALETLASPKAAPLIKSE